jgi:flavin-dependent dehydrogenase
MKTTDFKAPSSARVSAGPEADNTAAGFRLEDGARVAVVGGGPAGSFFSYFLLELAERAGIRLKVDVYEPRDFSASAPRGCNMCGGIVSESLVQALATEGIGLPTTVVQRGIDSYVLHTDVGSVRIDTPLREMRIAAVFRGPGPPDAGRVKWGSFDGFLQQQVREKGADVKRGRVDEIGWQSGRPASGPETGRPDTMPAVAVASAHTAALASLREFGLRYRPPRTTRTFIGEYTWAKPAWRQSSAARCTCSVEHPAPGVRGHNTQG